MSPADVSIAGLFSYPVKSCRAIAHNDAELGIRGIAGDRSWMIVDARSTPARFVTQRECPELATITARFDAHVSENGYRDSPLVLATDAHGSLIVTPPHKSSLLRVQVWKSELIAIDAGNEAAEWLARATGRAPAATRLVQFHPDDKRVCNAYYVGDSGAHTMFADGYPILVTNTESLSDLNQRMRRDAANALPMSRFRPNVVLAGLPAWDEDFVDTVTVGKVVLKLVKPCVRCVMTTTDQVSGVRFSEEPLNTLARFRTNPDLGGVTFGWNAIVVRGGTLNVGSVAGVEYRFDADK